MDKKEVIFKKNDARLKANILLFSVCITTLIFILALNPNILNSSFILMLQISISIPLLLTSIFVRSKIISTKNIEIWEEFGYFSFLIGYSFLINSLGILLSLLVSIQASMIFLISNISVSVIYSSIEIVLDKSKLISRSSKDLFFILVLVLGGILPSLGLY